MLGRAESLLHRTSEGKNCVMLTEQIPGARLFEAAVLG